MRITVELDVYDIARASAEHMAAFAQAAKSIADGRVKEEENETREQYAPCLTGHEEKGIESEEKAAEPADEGESAETKKPAPKKASKKQEKPKIRKAEKPAEEHKDEPEPEEPAEEHKAAPVKSEPEEAGEPTKDSREEPEEPESKDPEEEEPEEPAEKAITLEELQDLCKQRAKANKEIVPKLKELMIKFGIKKLHEIKKEDIPVFYKEVEALK